MVPAAASRRRSLFVIAVLALVIAASARSSATRDLAPAPSAVANDNRTPAGTLKNGTLELSLEIVMAIVHPEDEKGPGLYMPVFAESGRPPSNPAPLIRVPEGTAIHVSIKNALDHVATVHGLHTRPGDDRTPLDVPVGETRDVRFSAGAPGTYYYWATSTGAKDLAARDTGAVDMELAGVFVVDPRAGAPPDRILFLGVMGADADAFHDSLGTFTLNGRSWPYTERLTYRAGEHVRMRLVNLSNALHPMHLHGAYFKVLAAGDGERETTYADADARMAVTEPIDDGETRILEWVPERAGRWIFHCHLTPHFSPDNELPTVTYPASWGPEYAAPAKSAADHKNHDDMMGDSAGMAGLVVGITVTPGVTAAPSAISTLPARKLELVAAERPHGAANTATFGYALRERGQEAARLGEMTSPPVVLTQNQPAEITIVNRLALPTAVHWHGIELESFYDGVAGWGGNGRQVTPPVAPGGSFVARFTPPRAGTFIYHTHWHDRFQLTKGLYGPLIILPPGQTFDPETDKVVVISIDGPDQEKDAVLVNGSSSPAAMALRVGTTYRFRLINITADNPGMRVALRDGDAPVSWRRIAKDGADLPASQRTNVPAELRVSVGETFDFEFTPTQARTLQLDVLRPVDTHHVITRVDVR